MALKTLQEQDTAQLILHSDSNKQLFKDEDCPASVLQKTLKLSSYLLKKLTDISTSIWTCFTKDISLSMTLL
jgi:hypothetical protein